MNANHISASDRKAVCDLDIEWAQEFNIRNTGSPFVAARSSVTGKWMESDEIALMTLHKLRTKLGDKKQRNESKQWLRAQGMKGVFDEELADQ